MVSSNTTLFQPIQVGTSQLQHRIVLAPLTRLRSSPGHIPNELLVEYYAQRATAGGLLITEATLISPTAGGYIGAPGIFNQAQIDAWKKVTEAVHAKGGVIFLQLWHVGRATNAELIGGRQPVSASAIGVQEINDITGKTNDVPRALTQTEIKAVVAEYAQAGKNALEAGFDGVEAHGAYGYLPDQFLNSSSNHRTDEYGGSISNRARFHLEILGGLVDAIGSDHVAVRLSPFSGFQEVEDETPYETWGYLVSQLQERHPALAYIHMVEPLDDVRVKQSGFLSNKDANEPFRQIWKGPFISAGGYSTKTDVALKIHGEAQTHNLLIAFGRAYIANPDLVERVKNGWELNKYDRSTFYSSNPEGYIDYPFYQ